MNTIKTKLTFGLLVTGACVMILELLVTRLVAPHFGSSIFVWTAMIGVVLSFLALGYQFGGIKSENHASLQNLSLILIAVVCYLMMIIVTKEHLMSFVSVLFDPRFGIILTAILILGLPAFLLGIVSPFAAQLVITQAKFAGKDVGNLYAISTIGSILGTFLAGFYLIPEFGHIQVLYIVIISLLFISWFWFSAHRWYVIFLLLLCFMGMYTKVGTSHAQGLIYDQDTPYVRAQIFKQDNLLSLFLNGAYSSASWSNKPQELALDYTKYYDLINYFNTNKKVLMIGGAGLGYPRYFGLTHPESHLIVVEIDPTLTQIATDYLDYTPMSNVKIVHQDGRVFLKQSQEIFDSILIDAFASYTIPSQLVSYEAVELMRNSLSPDGTVVMNIIGTQTGDKSILLKNIITTFKQVFSYVVVLSTQAGGHSARPQNYILLASNSTQVSKLSPQISLGGETKNIRQVEFEMGQVFTDNWSPTEQLSFEIVN